MMHFDKKIAKYAKKSIQSDFAGSFLRDKYIPKAIDTFSDERAGIDYQSIPDSITRHMRGYHWQGIIDLFEGRRDSGIAYLCDESRILAKVYEHIYWDYYCHNYMAATSVKTITYEVASFVSAYSMGLDDCFEQGMRWLDVYIKEEDSLLNTDGLEGFMYSLRASHQAKAWQVAGKETWYHQFFQAGLDLTSTAEQMLEYRMEKIDEVFTRRKQMACLYADSANSLYPFEVMAYIRLYNYIEGSDIDVVHPYLEPFKNIIPPDKLVNKDLQKIEALIDKKTQQIKKHWETHKQ